MVALRIEYPAYKDDTIVKIIKITKLVDLYLDHVTGQPVIVFYGNEDGKKGCGYRYIIGHRITSKVKTFLVINNTLYNNLDISQNIEHFKLKIQNAITEQMIEDL